MQSVQVNLAIIDALKPLDLDNLSSSEGVKAWAEIINESEPHIKQIMFEVMTKSKDRLDEVVGDMNVRTMVEVLG